MRILYKQGSKNLQTEMLNRIGVTGCVFKYLNLGAEYNFVSKKKHHHTEFEVHFIKSGSQSYEIDDKTITFLLDIAYYNYGENKDFSFLKKLSKNVYFALVYSFSKSLGIYGLRLGTLTIAGNNLDQLKSKCISFARGTWSSPNRMACSIIEKIITNKTYKDQVMQEIEHQKLVLRNRSKIILDELAKHNIAPCPYKNGFFITIEVDDPEEIAYQLHLQDIYVTTISNAIRVAISGIPTSRIIDITNKIIEVIKKSK